MNDVIEETLNLQSNLNFGKAVLNLMKKFDVGELGDTMQNLVSSLPNKLVNDTEAWIDEITPLVSYI